MYENDGISSQNSLERIKSKFSSKWKGLWTFFVLLLCGTTPFWTTFECGSLLCFF